MEIFARKITEIISSGVLIRGVQYCMIMLAAGIVLVACSDTSDLPVEKEAASTLYVIDQNEARKIPPLFLISVNTLRSQSGLNDLDYSASLNAAAFTHALDMSLQNRPWHFGSDRSSPYFRVKRAGYQGALLGENISESFETPINVIKSWTVDESTRANLLDPDADQLGVGWKQDPDGRIWWVVLVGSSNKQSLAPENQPSELTEEAVAIPNSNG